MTLTRAEHISAAPSTEDIKLQNANPTVGGSDPRAKLLPDLRELAIEYEEDVALQTFTYMRTGGTAALVVFPRTIEQMSALMAAISRHGAAYKVIGNTSNLLFLDECRYSLLISTVRMDEITYDEDAGRLCALAGAMMPELSRQALYHGVTGFEGLEGIPGTVGGGLFMNAGAYGYELKDVFIGADVVHPNGEIQYLRLADFELGHRSSILRKQRKGSIVCRLYFSAKKGDPKKIYSKMEVYHAKRHKYQDFMYPNLGSIFSGSPYRALARKDAVFRVLSAVYFLFSYKLKIFRRESPINRAWLNDLAVKRFPLAYPIQPFSDKTLNCLVNRGQGTAAMVQYVRDLERLSEGRIPLENEIVDEF